MALDEAPPEQVADLLQQVRPFFRANFTHLPALSGPAVQIMGAAQKIMQASVAELARMVQSDPAAAAELLRVANSTMFRRGLVVQSIEDAIVRIGHSEVFSILVARATRGLFEPKMRRLYALLPETWYNVHHHTVVSAFGGAWLTGFLQLGQQDPTFLAGMFHDIGKLGALYCLAGLAAEGKLNYEVTYPVAAEVMEQVHVDFGCQMLESWRLPRPLIDVCLEHHDDAQARAAAGRPLSKQCHVVRVISCLDTLRQNAYVPAGLKRELRDSVAALGLDDAAMRQLGPKLTQLVEHVTELLHPGK